MEDSLRRRPPRRDISLESSEHQRQQAGQVHLEFAFERLRNSFDEVQNRCLERCRGTPVLAKNVDDGWQVIPNVLAHDRHESRELVEV